jgi:hypothetical protein
MAARAAATGGAGSAGCAPRPAGWPAGRPP